MTKDHNLCEHCNAYHPIDARSCSECKQLLVADARGKVAIWRLGDIEDGLLGPTAASISKTFGCEVIIQPAFLDERPSHRPSWSGRSATAIINQMLGRRTKGVLANLCITEDNITWNSQYHFLFGLAWLGLGSACMGIARMRDDHPDPPVLKRRMAAIAIHELGHAFGLDDQPYDHADCVMCGEVELDSIESIDSGTLQFCKACKSQLPRGLSGKRR